VSATVATPALGATVPTDHLTTAHVLYDGLPREYKLFIPASYDGAGLVLAFHGLYKEDTSLVRYVAPAAHAAGLIVAFPQGVDDSWNAGSCCGAARTAHVDDVGFASHLITTLSATYHPHSVVVAGFSNGAMLSWLIACSESSLITGLVDAGGTEGESSAACQPTRPLTVTAVHGGADPTVPYKGGGSMETQAGAIASPFRSITSVIDEWGQQHDGCDRQSTVQWPGWSRMRWSTCRKGVTATLYTINEMGHDVPSWSTGAPVDFGALIAQTALHG
jgi:polyhydroxybutyrate depolymerase